MSERMSDMDETGIKHPEIEVQLVGYGNAFMVIGRVCQALHRAGLPAEEVQQFTDAATSGDYDNVLRTAMAWVTVS